MELTASFPSVAFQQFVEKNKLPISYYHFRTSEDSQEPDSIQGHYSRTNYAAQLYHKLFKNSNFIETKNHLEANIILGTSLNFSIQRQLSPSQKMTHFDKTFSLGSKAGYHQVMREYEARTGKKPSFYSETYLLPDEREELEEAFSSSPLWIRKPAGGARGDGISVIDAIPKRLTERIVVQKYIARPLLINGLKFDLRFYVTIASLDPLQIFVHQNGLVRLATEPYTDNFSNLNNNFAHLTNFSINKKDPNFHATNDLSEDGKGNKWTHAPLWPYLKSAGFDPDAVRAEIDDAFTIILSNARDIFLQQKTYRHVFELFGFDVMLDETGKIYVLEVNVTPAMGTSSKLDLFVKEPVLRDLFNIGLVPLPSPYVDEQFNLLERASDIENQNDPMLLAALSFAAVTEYESRLQREGGFRCIYPVLQRIEKMAPEFPNFTPLDNILSNWVKMDDEQKIQFLNSNYPAYIQMIQKKE